MSSVSHGSSEGHDGPFASCGGPARVPRPEVPISLPKKATTASRILQFTKIVAAIAQYLTAAIVMGGKNVTPQALTAVFEAYLKAQADLDDARTAITAKQQARDAALAAAVAALPPLRKYLAGTYGEESTTYASFGFTAPKTPVKTVQVKAAAATKATTTRKAHKAALDAPVPPPATPATP